MALNYFNTEEVLELFLRDGSDLQDEEILEDYSEDQESESDRESLSFPLQNESFSEGAIQPLPPCDRPSLLQEEVRAKSSMFMFFCFLQDHGQV